MSSERYAEHNWNRLGPTQDAYDAACHAVDERKAELADLHARALAVAEEYEREPRLISSGAVASMLREWTGQFR